MPQFRFADQTREEMSVKGVLIFLGLVALLILAILRGRSHWRRDTSLAIDQIKASAVRQRQTVDLTEIQDLPVPVKKYLHLALKHGAAMIHSASMSQAGGFRAKPEMNGWSNMAALQIFSPTLAPLSGMPRYPSRKVSVSRCVTPTSAEKALCESS